MRVVRMKRAAQFRPGADNNTNANGGFNSDDASVRESARRLHYRRPGKRDCVNFVVKVDAVEKPDCMLHAR